MENLLKQYFPMIRTKKDILKEIRTTPTLLQTFNKWKPEQQEHFLNFCTGAKGVKVLYDGFFKEVMDPDITPHRLEKFLSLLLEQEITIVSVLANDSTRIADESSILITDIVVRLSDGSLANVEVQKVGYLFPGERCACYSSDLLLRQYKKARENSDDQQVNYKSIKPVYTIVLFEKGPKNFKKYSTTYIHRFEQRSDTGARLELLQKYIFIPLDIFQKNMHNKHITNELDAWLMFFSTDNIQDIIRLITDYPDFKPLYNTIYNICRNMEDVMGIFSEELRILDRNSLLFLPEYMQGEIDQLTDDLEQATKEKEQLAKENYQITLEKEQAVKKAEQAIKKAEEQTHRQISTVALNILREVAPEDFSAEKYAKMLLLDPSTIRQVYEKLHSDPAPDEDELFNLLNQRK